MIFNFLKLDDYFFDQKGFNLLNFNKEGFNEKNFNIFNLDKNSFDKFGIDFKKFNKKKFNSQEYNVDEFDKNNLNNLNHLNESRKIVKINSQFELTRKKPSNHNLKQNVLIKEAAAEEKERFEQLMTLKSQTAYSHTNTLNNVFLNKTARVSIRSIPLLVINTKCHIFVHPK
jgi:hypothetical protein